MGNPYLSTPGYEQRSGGSQVSFNITSTTVIKTKPGVVYRIFVNTAPTANGGVHDVATASSAGASNLIATIPQSTGVISLRAPYRSGLTINPGTSGVVSVSYE